MEPEKPTPVSEGAPRETGAEPELEPRGDAAADGNAELDTTKWVLLGPHGLRCGWAAALFIAIYEFLLVVVGTALVTLDPGLEWAGSSAGATLVRELIPLLSLLGAGTILMRLEGRRIGEYNLAVARGGLDFGWGAASGFAAISALVGALALGGWMRVAPGGPGAREAIEFGAAWAAAFLLVGLTEEGGFRCYLLATLERGINLWWALAAEGAVCGYAAVEGRQGAEGVYVFALLGLGPCAWLSWKRARGAGFWQAAWVTSTLFGAIHTANRGENRVGILAAAGMGLVFCASVRVTGSAWWAMGCHAAWDWGETYFFGTPDSGFVAKGHLLTTAAAGNTLWSGGTDGPEGSVLVIPVMALLALGLVAVYGRRQAGHRVLGRG